MEIGQQIFNNEKFVYKITVRKRVSLQQGEDSSRRLKRVYNLLAEEVEPVAGYLVDKIIANDRNGVTISYTGSTRMLLRIPGRLFSGRDIVSGKL